MSTISSITRQTVLVVDDDVSIAILLYEFLTGEGYRVLLARDGREALAMHASERPDVVICDWMMPAMDGPHFISALRSKAGAVAVTPVVLMSSGHGAPESLPGVPFLAKPFTLDALLEVVRTFTSLEHLAPPDETSQPAPGCRDT